MEQRDKEMQGGKETRCNVHVHGFHAPQSTTRMPSNATRSRKLRDPFPPILPPPSPNILSLVAPLCRILCVRRICILRAICFVSSRFVSFSFRFHQPSSSRARRQSRRSGARAEANEEGLVGEAISAALAEKNERTRTRTCIRKCGGARKCGDSQGAGALAPGPLDGACRRRDGGSGQGQAQRAGGEKNGRERRSEEHAGRTERRGEREGGRWGDERGQGGRGAREESWMDGTRGEKKERKEQGGSRRREK